MHFGQNLYNWFLSNAQSLVLMAIVVIGIYLGFKREFSKLIGFLVVALVAVGLVFNASGVKDVLLQLFKKVVEISKVCSISDAIGESIGIEKMSVEYTKALFQELEIMITTEGLDNIFYERAFERLIPQGYSFYVMETTEFFSAELDTVEDFQQAQKLIPASLY